MLKPLYSLTQKLFSRRQRELEVRWIKQSADSWLCRHFQARTIRPPQSTHSHQIEHLAKKTNSSGPRPLWQGYGAHNKQGSTRLPNDVRTKRLMGNFYTYLVKQLKPKTIVEFGTAFGVSGMYFLAGLCANQEGKLFTFEPNSDWAGFAKQNLSAISDQFELTNGTFEENVDVALPTERKIDLAFIDAIHTKDFVLPQLALVVARSSPGAVILFDDINFSDDMKQCWKEVAADNRFVASATLSGRVGIVELPASHLNSGR